MVKNLLPTRRVTGMADTVASPEIGASISTAAKTSIKASKLGRFSGGSKVLVLGAAAWA